MSIERVKRLPATMLGWAKRFGSGAVRLASGAREKLSSGIHFLDNHNGAITAVATLALAITTLAYLVEVREQREFDYRQLALENQPGISIESPGEFVVGDIIQTSSVVYNAGGPVEDLNVGAVMLCCAPLDQLPAGQGVLDPFTWGTYVHRMPNDRRHSRYMGIVHAVEQVEKSIQTPSVLIFMYVRADYTRPSNPIQKEERFSDSASFWWNARFKRWMNMTADGHETLESIVNEKGLFEEFDSLLAVTN